MKLLRPASYCWIVMMLPLLTGCAEEAPSGMVTGKVTLKGGEAVSMGTVNFYSKQHGIGSSGPVDGEGNYTLTQPLPVGEYTVFVAPPRPEAPQPGKSTSKSNAGFNVPLKYRSETKSDLIQNVKEGENKIDIELPAK